MNELVLWKLAELVLNAVEIGLERSAVIDKVKVLEGEGKSPAEIADAIRQMRDEALKSLN